MFSQCCNCFQRYRIICNQFSRDNGTTDGSCKHPAASNLQFIELSNHYITGNSLLIKIFVILILILLHEKFLQFDWLRAGGGGGVVSAYERGGDAHLKF